MLRLGPWDVFTLDCQNDLCGIWNMLPKHLIPYFTFLSLSLCFCCWRFFYLFPFFSGLKCRIAAGNEQGKKNNNNNRPYNLKMSTVEQILNGQTNDKKKNRNFIVKYVFFSLSLQNILNNLRFWHVYTHVYSTLTIW